MELLSGFGKRGQELGLLTKIADIEDTEFLSKYFVLQEFSPTFSAGKNSITFNGSDMLKSGSEILIECLDSAGNSLYIESTVVSNQFYKESSKYIFSIHVYAESANGPGKLILYGTLLNGHTVKWIGNIIIDKTKSNTSTVRFYSKPTLEVKSILSPTLNNVSELNKLIEFSKSFYSYAVNPQKDSVKLNKSNEDVDYRIYCKGIDKNSDPTGSFNSQMVGNDIELRVKTIQPPYSFKGISVNFTSSLKIKEVLNNSTIIVNDAIFYKNYGSETVVNVIDGELYVKYPYVSYNTSSEEDSYLRANTIIGEAIIKQSYADITYRNIKTFSGYISRHKLYRKSLVSPGDFEVISDEPLSPYEILQDNLTINKSFNLLGTFYNNYHVQKYWFTSSNALNITQSSDRLIEALNITSPNTYDQLDSINNYIIVKDNSSIINRNAVYYPFNQSEFTLSSGSSYDSNFIELKKDVSYILSLNAILKKDSTTLSDPNARLDFYFTSSSDNSNNDILSSTEQSGLLKIGSLSISDPIFEKSYTNSKIMFTINNDLYGTLIIVPRKCIATISELSLKPYGDYGFSPDTLVTRIPFPINVANEGFEIKSELFDINSTLVYSDLRTITSFDPSGESLLMYIPGLKDPNKTSFLSGSLEVSQSLWVDENAYVTGSLTIKGPVYFNGVVEGYNNNNRLMSINTTNNQVFYTNINDIDHVLNDEVNITLFDKNTTTLNNPYRLIPSIKGRNIYIPKIDLTPPTPTIKSLNIKYIIPNITGSIDEITHYWDELSQNWEDII